MPSTSKSVSNFSEPAHEKKGEESIRQQEEKQISQWEKRSSCTKGRRRQDRFQSHSPERRKHRSRSRSQEKRVRSSRHVHSRSRSPPYERTHVTQKGQWKEKPSTPVVSQVCTSTFCIAVGFHQYVI